MPTAKITWFYQFNDFGWSESLWQSYNADLSEAFTNANAYAFARAGLNGSGVAITAIRVSDDGVYRDSKYSPNSYYTAGAGIPAYTPQGGGGVVIGVPPVGGGALVSPANPYDAIQIRMEGGSLYRREMMFRGAPAQIMTSPPGPVLEGAYSIAFRAWATYCQVFYSFRCKNRNAPYNLQPVALVSIGPPGTITVPGNTLAVGNYVQLVGFRGFNGIRGRYYVTAIAGTTVTLGPNFTPLTSVPHPAGYVQLLSTTAVPIQPAYIPITAVKVITQTHRATGRPFNGPRGRRRARAS